MKNTCPHYNIFKGKRYCKKYEVDLSRGPHRNRCDWCLRSDSTHRYPSNLPTEDLSRCVIDIVDKDGNVLVKMT